MPILAGLFILTVIGTVVLSLIGIWKTFEKAGQPGWAALIPIYNIWTLLKIARKPAWWMFGLFIPFVSIIMLIATHIHIAKKFGRDKWFGVGLCVPLVSLFCWSVLGFGDDIYEAEHKRLEDQIDTIGAEPDSEEYWEPESWENARY